MALSSLSFLHYAFFSFFTPSRKDQSFPIKCSVSCSYASKTSAHSVFFVTGRYNEGENQSKLVCSFHLFDKMRREASLPREHLDFGGCMRDSEMDEAEFSSQRNSDRAEVDSSTEGQSADFSIGFNSLLQLATKLSAGVMPDYASIFKLFSLCVRLENPKLIRSIHASVIKFGIGQDRSITTTIVDAYAKCKDLESARRVFSKMPDPDIVSYNSMISGYSSNGLCDQALCLFICIQEKGLKPNHYTVTIMLGVCRTLVAIAEGKQLHAYIVKLQFLSEIAVSNALLTLYSKLGMMEEAEALFNKLPNRNFISWTAMISGLYQNGFYQQALRQFCYMCQHNERPNEYTYTIVFACCSSMKYVHNGRACHAQVIKNGLIAGVHVATSIVVLYSNFTEMDDAVKLFADIKTVASTVSWNALLMGFVSNEQNQDAVKFFKRMVEESVPCDEFTYSIILKACSCMPSLTSGEQIHSNLVKTGQKLTAQVGSSLIELYSRCGNLTEATAIFSEMNLRDTVAWNSIIKAHSHSGLAKTSFSLFREMIGEGLTPTRATFLAVLSACSHSGLVQKGLEIFDSMILDYGIVPEEKHYSCIVDLLGRSGRLKDARAFIKGLPMEPSTSIWRPLLAASRIHNNLPMAEYVAHRIQRKDPDDITTYLTLSNMYAEVGNWSDAEKQRKLMEVRGLKKEPGCSWIEVNQRMHKFFSRDKTHAETERIYEKLEELVRQMEEVGYVPGTKIEFGHKQKDKEEKHVIHHSEKLAVSFGLISLPAGQSVRVFKNLRICRDCHEAMKMISTITNRTIVIRDNNRFHYFKGGGCSCDDYW